jgi:hypothetical protein
MYLYRLQINWEIKKKLQLTLRTSSSSEGNSRSPTQYITSVSRQRSVYYRVYKSHCPSLSLPMDRRSPLNRIHLEDVNIGNILHILILTPVCSVMASVLVLLHTSLKKETVLFYEILRSVLQDDRYYFRSFAKKGLRSDGRYSHKVGPDS